MSASWMLSIRQHKLTKSFLNEQHSVGILHQKVKNIKYKEFDLRAELFVVGVCKWLQMYCGTQGSLCGLHQPLVHCGV